MKTMDNRQNYQRQERDLIHPVVRAQDITKENFSDMAEKVIKSYDNMGKAITSTQLRQFVPLINQVAYSNKGCVGELTSEEQGQLQYLKTRFVYAAGREQKVKNFLVKADILNYIKLISKSGQKQDLDVFAKYYESLIAFHKFNGGEN
ncbi:MAG: type III-A CRISPR-associated protein Csm2 [Clostridiales bacterium]|nr:type III-A CRISPR-associated protein Csm2 [Clostridiales bacterium]